MVFSFLSLSPLKRCHTALNSSPITFVWWFLFNHLHSEKVKYSLGSQSNLTECIVFVQLDILFIWISHGSLFWLEKKDGRVNSKSAQVIWARKFRVLEQSHLKSIFSRSKNNTVYQTQCTTWCFFSIFSLFLHIYVCMCVCMYLYTWEIHGFLICLIFLNQWVRSLFSWKIDSSICVFFNFCVMCHSSSCWHVLDIIAA